MVQVRPTTASARSSAQTSPLPSVSEIVPPRDSARTRPAPSPIVDEGAAPSSATPVALPSSWFASEYPRGCHIIAGVVKSVEAVVVNYRWDTADSNRKLFHAARVDIDDGTTGNCRQSGLHGVKASLGPDDPLSRHNELGGPCKHVDVGAPVRGSVPIREGDVLCGRITRYSGGYFRSTEMAVFSDRKELLLAFADAMPRDARPLRGWFFGVGPGRDCFDAEWDPRCRADVTIVHEGERVTFTRDSPSQRLGGYDVTAFGYRNGRLAVWLQWLKTSGYGFSIARRRR